MRKELFLIFDPKQVASQTHIIEVQLRRLDKSLADIAEERMEQKDNETGLQQADPFPGGSVRNTSIGSQALKMEELANPTGAQLDEFFKG